MYNEHTDKTCKASSSSIAWKHETTFDDVFLLFAAEDDLPYDEISSSSIVLRLLKENEIRVELEVNGFNSHPNFQVEARKSELLLLFFGKRKINKNFTSPDETETVVKVRSEWNLDLDEYSV